jgi:hypothetical protein
MTVKIQGPDSDLATSFAHAIVDFNELSKDQTPSYDDWAVYLYANGGLLIEKVDDPGQYVTGTPSQIIGYLDSDQTNRTTGYPIFEWTGYPATQNNVNAYPHGTVGQVTGANGLYYDSLDSYISKNYYPVQYSFGFRQKNNQWYICQAILTITGHSRKHS